MAKSKILALLFTTFVIALLLMSGPVDGFTLNLLVSKEKPKQGELVTFTAQINIEQTERPSINKLILELSGREKISCTFDKDGQPLNGCDNIKITKIQDPGYNYGYDYNFGYGYGFAPGTLKYKVEIDTKKLKPGTYTSLFKAEINDQVYTQSGKTITLRDDGNSDGSSCAKEWTCNSWSSCSAGMQYRECYRNLNACEIEEMPEQERLCLLEDGTNFLDEDSSLNSLGISNIEPETRYSIDFAGNSLPEGLQFIIILLLMNCIITTINIIMKVRENSHLRSRKSRKLPQMPPVKKEK